jgi:hypothetical protein
MALKISVKDIVKESRTKHPKLLTEILENMRVFKGKKSYSEYAPSLDFNNPQSRKTISNTLYDLWQYCLEKEIPQLNMLVVLKREGIPSTGIETWYEEQFNTLKKYNEYCELHAKLAEFILQNEIVVLE